MRPIHISLSPDLRFKEVVMAIKTIIWGANGGEAIKVGNRLKEIIGYRYPMVLFNSGRSALWAALSAIGVKGGDEILLQGFTCVATVNSIRWTGASPVWVDINERTFNMDPADLERKLSERSKAVIIQHTFGRAAEIEEVKKICKRRGIYLIEDCAHVIGGEYMGRQLGRWGDIGIFSFGRDKAASSVFGGAAGTDRKEIYEKLSVVWQELPQSNDKWVQQQLWHPVLSWIALLTYHFLSLGKVILWGGQKIGWLSLAVFREERLGQKPMVFPAKYPDQLAVLGMSQLADIKQFNKRRLRLSQIYKKKLGLRNIDADTVYLRVPVQVKDLNLILAKAKERGWIWGDWYRNVITPVDNPSIFSYKIGDCPVAERVAGKVINLPTCFYITDKQATAMAEALSLWLK